MRHTFKKETAGEQRLLCSIAFVCYSATLASLALLGYSLSALTLSAVGQQITAVYFAFGNVAP